MNTLKRIKQYIDYKGITNQNFEKQIGFSNGAFASQLKNNRTIGVDKLENILIAFPELNPEWLLTGNGEMIKTKSKENVPINLGDKIGDKLGDKPNVKKRYAIESPEMPMVTEENAVYKSNTGIPLIPIDAMAGFGTGAVQVMHYDTSKYIVPEFSELNVDFMIRVKGSSMVPKYNSGDLVACKKLVITDIFFQWNKVYVLDTEQGALIKRVKKGSRDNYILLISDNKNYDPFELHLSKIFAVALVVGVIRLE
jgi:repressor LexA